MKTGSTHLRDGLDSSLPQLQDQTRLRGDTHPREQAGVDAEHGSKVLPCFCCHQHRKGSKWSRPPKGHGLPSLHGGDLAAMWQSEFTSIIYPYSNANSDLPHFL